MAKVKQLAVDLTIKGDEIAAEVLIATSDWKNSSNVDIENNVDVGGGGATEKRSWTQILPAGDFIYLNTNRILSYSTSDDPSDGIVYQSGAYAGVGQIQIEPKDIQSGAEFKDVREISGGNYGTGTEELTTEVVDIGETAIDVDDADWFKVDDFIMIDSEVMEVISISSNTLTVKRGALGSTDVAHTEDDELHYFFGNEYLPYNTGKCQTDANGRFKQRGAFFGYARTTDKVADGLVPGSAAIGPFYTEGGYLDWGLSGITAGGETGLAASTAYSFNLVVDEYNVGGIDSTTSETEITFTTDANDTTWNGSSNAVLQKIQDAIDVQFYTSSSGLKNKKITIGIVNGDIRVTSHSNHSDTVVGISKLTTSTTPFDVGNFPSLVDGDHPNMLGSPHGAAGTDTIVYGPKTTLAPETIDDKASGKTETNSSAFIFDDGNSNLLYQGRKVGWIDYEKGHCEWHVPSLPNAEFKIHGNSHSAHSGGIKGGLLGFNSIASIMARSVNDKENTKLKMILFG